MRTPKLNDSLPWTTSTGPGRSVLNDKRRRWALIGLVVVSFLVISQFSLNTPAPRPVESEPEPERIVEAPQAEPEPIRPARMPVCEVEYDEGELGNRRMTAEQCDELFGPKLFREAELARKYYTSRGGISRKDIEEGQADATIRLLISKERIYVKEVSWAPNSRALAALQSLQEAILSSPEPIPDLEFSISVMDTGPPGAARWIMDRVEEDAGKAWLAPDFAFSSWPEPWVGSWHDFRCRVAHYERRLEWADKKPTLFWRGVAMTDGRRELVGLSDRYDWLDAQEIRWDDADGKSNPKIISMPEHCQYRYLAQTEGFAYSGCASRSESFDARSRLKYLLHCNSLVVTHKPKYVQHFDGLFDSDPHSTHQNMVVLKGEGWSDLGEQMEYFLTEEGDRKAQRIARNGRLTFEKYLSPAAVACYWRRILSTYAEQLNDDVFPLDKRGTIDLESFMLTRTLEWHPA